MRELGIFSWFGHALPLAERFARIADAGFASTCLWLEPAEEAAEAAPDTIPEMARVRGLAIDNVHASPIGCNGLWEPDGGAQVMGAYRDAIAYCGRHAIGKVVLHLTDGHLPPPLTAVGFDRLRALVELAREQGVLPVVENTRRPDCVDAVLAAFGAEDLGFCYDSSHDLLYGRPTTAILQRWGERLATIHLSDNHGEYDDHLLPGEGSGDWQAIPAAFPQTYAGPLMLEVAAARDDKRSCEAFLGDALARARHLAQRLPGAP